MLTKGKKQDREQIQIISIEELVPEDHLVREIDRAISFDFIYDEVEELYCLDNGRPSIDPVVLFKIILIKYIFGIRSIRQTIKDIAVNMAYRWFLGYGMTESIPHFTAFGKNYERRFADSDIFEKIFEHILLEAVRCKFVDAKAVFIDATHIKASANKNKSVNEAVKIEAKHYTYYRGLARLRMQALLTFAAMNLKKLAKWKKKNAPFSELLCDFILFWKYCARAFFCV